MGWFPCCNSRVPEYPEYVIVTVNNLSEKSPSECGSCSSFNSVDYLCSYLATYTSGSSKMVWYKHTLASPICDFNYVLFCFTTNVSGPTFIAAAPVWFGNDGLIVGLSDIDTFDSNGVPTSFAIGIYGQKDLGVGGFGGFNKHSFSETTDGETVTGGKCTISVSTYFRMKTP